MTQKQQLAKLQHLSTIVLDSRLAKLKAAARAKLESEAHLADLAASPIAPDALSKVAAEIAVLSYQRWADARRAELNMVLARQTVVWLEAREAACEAFGKMEALGGIATKLAAVTRPRD